MRILSSLVGNSSSCSICKADQDRSLLGGAPKGELELANGSLAPKMLDVGLGAGCGEVVVALGGGNVGAGGCAIGVLGEGMSSQRRSRMASGTCG